MRNSFAVNKMNCFVEFLITTQSIFCEIQVHETNMLFKTEKRKKKVNQRPKLYSCIDLT